MAVSADQVAPDGGEKFAASSTARWNRPAVVLCAGVAAVAVVGVAGWQVAEFRTLSNDADRNGEIISAAKLVTAGLVSLDYNRADDDLNRIKDTSTGQFRAQFDELAVSFRQVLGQGKVQSTGAVKEAGIVEADADQATVLAAVTSVVKNSEAVDGQQRVYRMRVQLANQDNRWLVSEVEFVDE